MPFNYFGFIIMLEICLQLLWASDYSDCIFHFRYINLLLGDWSDFWWVYYLY